MFEKGSVELLLEATCILSAPVLMGQYLYTGHTVEVDEIEWISPIKIITQEMK